MPRTKLIVTYLILMSLAWGAILLIKQNFYEFLSQGILLPPMIAAIWLWWPVAIYLVWVNLPIFRAEKKKRDRKSANNSSEGCNK